MYVDGVGTQEGIGGGISPAPKSAGDGRWAGEFVSLSLTLWWVLMTAGSSEEGGKFTCLDGGNHPSLASPANPFLFPSLNPSLCPSPFNRISDVAKNVRPM
jgi:hypothetical protein